MRQSSRTFEQRFWDRTQPNGECLDWVGVKNNKGYGFYRKTPCVLAHRVAWEIANGMEVPPGMYVLHSCDRPGCVAAAHLRLGDQFDNMADMSRRGRSFHALKTHCPRGHAYTPENTARRGAKNSRTCLACERARHQRRRIEMREAA